MIACLKNVIAQCKVIWRNLFLSIKRIHQRPCPKGEKNDIIYLSFFFPEKMFTYCVSNFSLQQYDLWTNSNLLCRWWVNSHWEKKKKITTLKNVDMVHILLGENTPSRATVQACINFNASYRLRNLKKKKKIITNTRVKFLWGWKLIHLRPSKLTCKISSKQLCLEIFWYFSDDKYCFVFKWKLEEMRRKLRSQSHVL